MPGDSGENTILTGKKAVFFKGEFLTEENGQYKSHYGYGNYEFDKYDPYWEDELDEMKDLNGDGRINCFSLKRLIDKFPLIGNHVEYVYAHTEYTIPWNVKASNKYYTFSFGKSKCELTTKSCDLTFEKGSTLKVDKHDVQFKKENVTENSNGNNLTITSDRFKFTSGNIIESISLKEYKYTASFNDLYFDLRDVEKNWVDSKTEFTYRIEGNSIIIENSEETYSGTIDQDNREINLRKTYPSSSDKMYFEIKY